MHDEKPKKKKKADEDEDKKSGSEDSDDNELNNPVYKRLDAISLSIYDE